MEAGPRGKRSSTHSTPSPACPLALTLLARRGSDARRGGWSARPSPIHSPARRRLRHGRRARGAGAESVAGRRQGALHSICAPNVLAALTGRLLHGARSSRCTIVTSKSGARPRPFMTLAKTRGSASPLADRCRGRPRASLLRSPPRQAAIPSALSWRRWGCGRRRRWRTPTGRSASSLHGRPARPQPSRPPQALRRARSRAAWA